MRRRPEKRIGRNSSTNSYMLEAPDVVARTIRAFVLNP